MNIHDIAITSLETISCFDIATGAYLFTMDELQNASISNSEEKQDVTGKQGRKLTSLKKNKSVVVSGTNGLVSGGLFELQVGSKFENKVTEVMWTDHLTVSGNSATTNYTAVGTEGAEISGVYVKNADGIPMHFHGLFFQAALPPTEKLSTRRFLDSPSCSQNWRFRLSSGGDEAGLITFRYETFDYIYRHLLRYADRFICLRK